jgi:predicted RNase H-like nuclease (RuvC/YqgF family)
MFMALEQHLTESKRVEQIINELTQILQQISTMEATAEKQRREAEELRKSEMMNRKVIEQLEEQLSQEKKKSDALSMDLERMTDQRNRLQVEIRGMQESTVRQMALRDAERDRLRENLEKEMAERKETVDLFKKSFTHIQDLVNSAQSVIGLPNQSGLLEGDMQRGKA